jgi:hypothetical protein
MSEPTALKPEGSDPAARQSALFASVVLQQTNMALIFLGQVPHPDTGQRVVDLEAAQTFIDTLEMLEARTKGNCTQPEQMMLKQSLSTARMAFVEAVQHGPSAAAAPEGEGPAPQRTPTGTAGSAPAPPAETPEPQKKFTKKY